MLANKLYPQLSTADSPIAAVSMYQRLADIDHLRYYGAFMDLALFTCSKRDVLTGWVTHYVGVARRVRSWTAVYVYESDVPKTL